MPAPVEHTFTVGQAVVFATAHRRASHIQHGTITALHVSLGPWVHITTEAGTVHKVRPSRVTAV